MPPVATDSSIARASRSASMRRFGNPVRESSRARRAFSSAEAWSRREALRTVRNSSTHSSARPPATTAVTVRTADDTASAVPW